MSTIPVNTRKQRLPPSWLLLTLALVSLLIGVNQCSINKEERIDFNAQVKPILNKHCIHCHGGVKQNGGFSMMTREKILAATDSGHPAIQPGNAASSELIKRLTTDDPEERMPFEAPPLPKEAIDILTQWIDEGAEWGLHWAYNRVKPVEVPAETAVALGSTNEPINEKWVSNNIDHFVLKTLKENDLTPSAIADKRSLLRRLSLDIIGLPAPKSLATQFLQTTNPISYEAVVDSLLASPHFGEKWASMWLDLARYADSKGFERDPNRTIYPYRDYVIKAFNEDLPYNQFLIEQLAGDLLPNPTDDQLIATGFHRNTATNDEGGTNNEEYRVAAVVDRVNTTGQALLGTTFACIQCHGHPYDPFEHEEYYQMMAFFNNTRDMDTHKDYPLLRRYAPADSLKLAQLTKWVAKVESPERVAEIRTFLKTWQPTIYSIDTDSLLNAAFYDTKYLGFRKGGQVRMRNITLTDKNKVLIRGFTRVKGGHFTIRLDKADGKKIIDFPLPLTKSKGYQFIEIPLVATTGKHDLYLQYENPTLEDPDKNAFQIDWFYFTKDFPGQDDAEYETQLQHFWDLMEAEPVSTLITMDNPAERQRSTKVFNRGNWQLLTKEVQPKVPTVLNDFPANAPKNRLGLAQWITDQENPLTARTMVNRLWEQLFGQGLVETVEDLGTQGALPTHPELLDWLAYQYMHDFNWSTKRLLKEIVTSSTYRQSSKVTKELLEKDPYNRLLTRGPRVRLSAEQIRDQTLAVSGLLNPKMYGPPVMPYQPDGIWNMPYGGDRWTMSDNGNQYRRAIYTFVKRSAPYPSFETFDVNPRQVCVSRRIRTNTPLQALVTLNDPVYVEAAKSFALRLQATTTNVSEQIKTGYELAIGQPIQQKKLAILETLYSTTLADFKKDKAAAQQLVSKMNNTEKAAATAAMMVVTNAILNLDEYMMK